MKTNLLIVCLLTSAFAATVRSKPHGKHHASPKTSEADPEQWSEEKVLPTFTSFEASSQEQGDTDVSYDDGLVKEDGGLEETEQDEKSSPVLLSEEALADLLRGSEEEEEEEEKAVEEVEEVEDRSEQGEEAGDDGGAEMMAKEGEVERGSEEDSDSSSTESEIPVDMDYAGDSDLLESAKEEVTPLVNDNTDTDTNTDANADGDLIPTEEIRAGGDIPEGNDYEAQDGDEATESLEERDQEGVTTESKGLEETIQQEASQGEGEKAGDNEDIEAQEAKNSVELGGADNVVAEAPGEGGEEESDRNDSGNHTKGKARKQKKNVRAKKAPEPRDEAATEESQQPLQKIHVERGPDTADNTVQKSKKRKAGKWASLVGMNPIQIRATEELFQDQLSLDEGKQEAPVNPCNNFRCKRGKTCKVNEVNKPVCVCQDPSSCTPSVSEIEHVCGTDNKTYDTSCELFATKCSLEGTKRGHRLHLDYTGSCKYIAPCQEGELLQFPLRMRDWLKNVLLQMYERDMRNPGFLTPKQRVRVQKIYESERRLHAGDHPIEMLVRDFEKNYNMYIYPVHWQFAQMDQHPADRFLSHSELAPLRVPLVPMEHCTSRFFHECDADKDKLVSFKEWGHCFGIKDEDLDLNLLF